MSKSLFRRATNRFFHVIARNGPGSTSLRPWLHRARGVKVGRKVFIGDGVYLDNEFPECIEIQDFVQISIRAIVIAHTQGEGRVVIGRAAFVGPNCVIICGAGRTLTIGEGAVIAAGSVITRSVPPGLYVAPPGVKPVAKVRVPLPFAQTLAEFSAGLEQIPPRGCANTPKEGE